MSRGLGGTRSSGCSSLSDPNGHSLADRFVVNGAGVLQSTVLQHGRRSVEDAIYDTQSMRAFVGMELARESGPESATLLKFRRLLEKNDLTQCMFFAVNAAVIEAHVQHERRRGRLVSGRGGRAFWQCSGEPSVDAMDRDFGRGIFAGPGLHDRCDCYVGKDR